MSASIIFFTIFPQSHEALLALAHTITVEEVNSIARSLLSFVSHYQHEEEAVAAWSSAPQHWMDWGPTRSTCVVACIPAFTDESGHSTGDCPSVPQAARHS
jgi:hypothetical protein